MLAQRGRAAYTGERSRDSVDAGAIGVAVMFEAVSKAWQEAELEPGSMGQCGKRVRGRGGWTLARSVQRR